MKKLALGFLVLAVALLSAASVVATKHEMVCMMQDMVLTKPGIPIQHDGKTYYGCCQMCKDKIASDPERYTKATDPVSGKTVDKATAVIYGLEGSAYYFESKASMKTFAGNPKKYLRK